MKLRDYQQNAVDAVHPGQPRGQVIAACGVGKTLMAMYSAVKLLDGTSGTVLMLFPTLGLLEQTYQVWRAESPLAFSALAVCSAVIEDDEDIDRADLPVRSTTSAEQLTRWLVDTAGVRVVFGTYQSVGVIADAHRHFGAPRFSVLIADEAHRTAGRRGKPFATILHDRHIPAQHRLFFTATPKVHSGQRTQAGRAPRRAVASMDDPDLYGERLFTLSTREAIDRGILAPFKVAVIAVSDSAVASAMRDLRLIKLAAGEDGSARADHVAAAIALTQAASDYQLSSVLAFHNTIAASQQFSETFARTHALLSARGLVRDGRRASVTHIDGSSPLHERKEVAEVTLGVHKPDIWELVSNCRCFSEGINLPALDAVFFAEPRSSEVDVAQAVGRAIRKNPYHDRPSLIVLALTVDDSLDAETVIDISNFARARQVLSALETHDPSIAADLARLRETLTDGLPQDSSDGSVRTDLVDIVLPADLPPHLAEQFLRAFSVHTVDTLTRQWEENLAALVAYVAEYGHASPPQQYRDLAGRALGQWVSGQRRAHARSALSALRVQRLQELPGWAWNSLDARWEESFAALAAYTAQHGHAYPPRDYAGPSRVHLNQWVLTQRRPGYRERLREDQRKRLEDLPGWSWTPRQRSWDVNFAALATYVEEHGTADPPRDYLTADGIALGRWVAELRTPSRVRRMAAQRRRQLEQLPGWSWDAARRVTWEEHFTALQEFAARHGHASPSADYCTENGMMLGRWVSEQRHHRGRGEHRLSVDKQQMLAQLPGWAWSVREAQWEANFAALADFADRHRHCDVPSGLATESGADVGQWVRTQRRMYRDGSLSASRAARLSGLAGWSWNYRRDDASFEVWFDELVDYARVHGHARPAQHYRTASGRALGQWVGRQRRAYRTGVLPSERIARLESAPGWTWNAFEERWDQGLAELRRYSAEHASVDPPARFVTSSGYRLAEWVNDQRRRHRRGELAQSRAEILAELPGWHW